MNDQNRVLIRKGARELTPRKPTKSMEAFELRPSAPPHLLRMEICISVRLAAKHRRLRSSVPKALL